MTKNISEEVKKATGVIEFNMTNDYLFRDVLQTQNLALKGLIGAMLHIPREEIEKVWVLNPVEMGDYKDEKTFVLDIKVELNNETIINLEMQVIKERYWTNRSLSYLSRLFNKLQKGDDYERVSPVIHIGFLDFDLFEDEVEFYAEYQMMNVRTHRLFNSNFRLFVLSLNRAQIAREEDKVWKIDEWARLFKANTWEELRMIAANDEAMASVMEPMFLNNTDNIRREMMLARQEAINHEKRMKKQIKELSEKNAELSEMLEELRAENARLKKNL